VSLWNSEPCAEWEQALARYPEVVRAQQVHGLAELDEWYRGEFPGLIATRRPAYITHAELERVTAWKMKRGVWRERNRLLVAGNSPATVKSTSQKAFAAVPDVRRPVSLFSDLSGVGPATASAVLAAYAPALFPFFDELVAQQIPDLGTVAFTAAYYQRYATALRTRAARLNAQGTPCEWTAHAAGLALWAAAGGKNAQTAARPVDSAA
jgi:hypothetical protein